MVINMNELTLELDYYFNSGKIIITNDAKEYEKEFLEYINSINGIIDFKIINDNTVYIKYNSKIINIEMIKLEILFYLSLLNIPSILSFNKHSNNKLEKYNIIIKDLCCEYCLMNIIEKLLDTNGINSAYSNFDFNSKKDIKIFIEYDKSIIDIEDIHKLENELN